MPEYFAALTLVFFIGMVFVRIVTLNRKGIDAVHFGRLDKKDFLIPPFPIFYFYLVFANAFHLPTVTNQEFFQSVPLQWVGVILCVAGLALVMWSLVSFGTSFRLGIDVENPDQLITTGAFAFSRNPIYTAFALVLVGEFLVFPNWILLVYIFAGAWLFHRQVLREEAFLKQYYGHEYEEYSKRVRRYL